MKLGLILAAAVIVFGGSTAAADYHAPHNAAGQPDLEGVWSTHFFLPLEASADAPSLTLPEAEAAAYARKLAAERSGLAAFSQDPEIAEIAGNPDRSDLALVRGQRRTRQIVEPADGKLPLTPRARGTLRAIEGFMRTVSEPPFPKDGPEQRPNWERCLVGQGQPPIAILSDINPRQIVQTRDAVVILAEYGPDLRIIPFTDRHGPALQATTLGDSIARWEGDTLVVETVGLPAKDAIRPFPILFVPPSAKVIERFTRLSATELLYQYTVVDPTTYTGPWLAEYSLYATPKPIYEFACHEGNYSLPNILAGARAAEAAARAPKPAGGQ
jgi:hypothetical protein